MKPCPGKPRIWSYAASGESKVRNSQSPSRFIPSDLPLRASQELRASIIAARDGNLLKPSASGLA